MRAFARRPAVLFDLDGTLIDSIGLILASARHASTTCALPAPSDEEFASHIGVPLVEQFRRYTTDEAQIAALTAGYRAFQVEHHDRLTRCYEDVVDTVAALHEAGHPVGVVTSKISTLAGRGLALVGLDRYIDVLIGADSTLRHKPHPEPVYAALDALGVAPADAVFVGDSPFDVAAGNAAGVVSIGVTWGAFAREALEPVRPAHVIGRIVELPPLLRQLFPVQTFRPERPSDPVSSPGPTDA